MSPEAITEKSNPRRALIAGAVILVAASGLALTWRGRAAAGQQARQAPLIEAVKQGDLSAVKRLLGGGADPNVRVARTTKPSLAERSEGGKPYLGDTALMLAVEKGKTPLVELLLSKGADVNGAGEAGYTPLMTAVRW